MTDLDRSGGAAFDDPDVARAYANRAPYPAALIDRLAALAPARRRALDLGCGPGKLTLPLAAKPSARRSGCGPTT
ncbi:MAG TPA: hypothetical protein VG939_13930 [Caulobacteraceae bacterium]|nr:hypothetical protein [Caulobacteraceae bacterium]